MRRVAAAFEKADLRPLLAAIDENIVWKSASTVDGAFPFGGIYNRQIGVVQVTSQIGTRYAFTRFAPTEILSQGEIVWGLFGIEGDYLTRTGHRSGKAFKIDCAIRWRVRDGRVIEHQAFFDTNALRLQEEAVP